MKKTLLFIMMLLSYGVSHAITSTTLDLTGGWSYARVGSANMSFNAWGHIDVSKLVSDIDVANYKSVKISYSDATENAFKIVTIGKKAKGTEPETYDENNIFESQALTGTEGTVTLTFNSSNYTGNVYKTTSTIISSIDLYNETGNDASIKVTGVVLIDNNDVETTLGYSSRWSATISNTPELRFRFASWGQMGHNTWKTDLGANSLHRFTVNFAEAVPADYKFRIYTPDGDDEGTDDDESFVDIITGVTSASVDIDYSYNNIDLTNGGSSASTICLSSVTRTVYSITPLWSTGQIAADWTNVTALATDGKGELANAKIGDEIRITYASVTNLNDNIIQINNGHTYEALSNSAVFHPTTESGTFCYKLGAEDVERIHESGIVVSIKNLTMSKIELLSNEGNEALTYSPITITSAGVATYNSSQKLDFTGKSLKAYVASSIDAVNNTVTMTRVYKVPANTGLYLIGEEDDYEIPYLDGDADDMGTNLLVATNLWQSKVYESMENEYRYILASKSGVVGLYKVTSSGLSNTESEAGTYYGKKYHTLAAHKAYLQTATDIAPTSGARIALNFDDGETTYIDVLPTNNEKRMENIGYYNLAGQRVAQPTKGLYIVNGKKVIIK